MRAQDATTAEDASSASRLDNSHDAELRKLPGVDLFIVDHFALQSLDALDAADASGVIVERHRAAATVVTSKREPIVWLGLTADPLLAKSAVDRPAVRRVRTRPRRRVRPPTPDSSRVSAVSASADSSPRSRRWESATAGHAGIERQKSDSPGP